MEQRFETPVRPFGTFPSAKKTDASGERDRRFESPSLLRRVHSYLTKADAVQRGPQDGSLVGADVARAANFANDPDQRASLNDLQRAIDHAHLQKKVHVLLVLPGRGPVRHHHRRPFACHKVFTRSQMRLDDLAQLVDGEH
jgi:hypothetical protein